MTTNASDRQTTLAAVATVGVANLGAGKGVAMTLPAGAVLLRLLVLTTTAFNPGGTDTATLTVSDGTTTFANAVDIETTGSETVANTPKYYPTGGKLSITLAETGVAPATAGQAIVVAEYVVVGRWSENQY